MRHQCDIFRPLNPPLNLSYIPKSVVRDTNVTSKVIGKFQVACKSSSATVCEILFKIALLAMHHKLRGRFMT